MTSNARLPEGWQACAPFHLSLFSLVRSKNSFLHYHPTRWKTWWQLLIGSNLFSPLNIYPPNCCLLLLSWLIYFEEISDQDLTDLSASGISLFIKCTTVEGIVVSHEKAGELRDNGILMPTTCARSAVRYKENSLVSSSHANGYIIQDSCCGVDPAWDYMKRRWAGFWNSYIQTNHVRYGT